jgi:hypothetical protein
MQDATKFPRRAMGPKSDNHEFLEQPEQWRRSLDGRLQSISTRSQIYQKTKCYHVNCTNGAICTATRPGESRRGPLTFLGLRVPHRAFLPGTRMMELATTASLLGTRTMQMRGATTRALGMKGTMFNPVQTNINLISSGAVLTEVSVLPWPRRSTPATSTFPSETSQP